MDQRSAVTRQHGMNHVQAVTMDGKIFLGCGLQGPFPAEASVPDLLVFDPSSGTWDVKKDLVPTDRRRGSSGAVALDGKIYFIGGTTHGHASGTVPWTDVYDTRVGTWRRLKDAPHARDHFQAAVVDGKIYAIGGRRSNQAKGRTFEDVEPSIDVYDISSDSWTTLPVSSNLPTPRGGCTAVAMGSHIIIIGGESIQPKAHDQADVFDTKTGKWSSLPSMVTGRHGTQAIARNNTIIIVAGCGMQGGSPELNTMELLHPSFPEK